MCVCVCVITVTGTTPGLQLPAVQQKEDNPSPVSISSTFLLFFFFSLLTLYLLALPSLPVFLQKAVPCVCSYRKLICCSLCVFLQKPHLLFPVCVPTESSSAVPCVFLQKPHLLFPVCVLQKPYLLSRLCAGEGGRWGVVGDSMGQGELCTPGTCVR